MLTFTRSVGTAPGTTVVNVNGLGAICPPDPLPLHKWANLPPPPPPPPAPLPCPAIAVPTGTPKECRAWVLKAQPVRPVPAAGVKMTVEKVAIQPTVRAMLHRSYGDDVALRGGGLGLVLEPAEITRTLPGGPPYLLDARANVLVSDTEESYYHDTALGAIPTDDEMGRNMCYTPVHSGWTFAQQTANLSGALGENTEAIETLAKYQRRLQVLHICSTIAMFLMAGTAIYRAVKEVK